MSTKEPKPESQDGPAYDSSVRPISEMIAEIFAQVPDEEWDKVPRDLASNLDHYIYGAERKDTTSILDEEQRTFERERQRLLATSEGKFVLIKGDRIVDVFDSEDIAIAEGFAQLGNTPFFVKQITKVDTPLNFTRDIFGR